MRAVSVQAYQKAALELTLQLAADKNKYSTVELLLKDGRADPLENTEYAVRLASQLGHTEAVSVLMRDPRARAGIPGKDKSCAQLAWIKAVQQDHGQLIPILISEGQINPSQYHNETIRYAIKNKKTSVLFALAQDPRVDVTLNDNQLITQASSECQLELMEILLRNPNVKLRSSNNDPDQHRNTWWYGPLVAAIKRGCLEGIRILMKDSRSQV